jgi:pectate lyase
MAKKKLPIRFKGFSPPVVPQTEYETQSGGWGNLFNGGAGIQGAGNIEPVEFTDYEAMWADVIATGNTPKSYLYTGPDWIGVQTTRRAFEINNIAKKTITGQGQLIEYATLRLTGIEDWIYRNFRHRRTKFDDWHPTSVDAIRVQDSNGTWFDHLFIDGEGTIPGTELITDGLIDIKASDYFVVSNSRLWGGRATLNWGASTSDIETPPFVHGTMRNCWLQNNMYRQPRGKKMYLGLHNNFFIYDPKYENTEDQWGSARIVEIGGKVQVYSEGNYYGTHRRCFYDWENSDEMDSGLVSVNDFFEPQWVGETGERWNDSIHPVRPDQVSWSPAGTSGYTFQTPIMSAAEARSYALANAGVKPIS